MKYCSQCGKEMADYVDMCHDCGSLLFQAKELTSQQKEKWILQQKKEKIRKDNLYPVIEILLYIGSIFIFISIFSKYIYNFSREYFFINILLILIYAFSSAFYFLLYFSTRKSNIYLYFIMFSIALIFKSYLNYYHERNFYLILFCIIGSIFTIASYFLLSNNFTKNDLIKTCFYGVSSVIIWSVIQDVRFMFTSTFLKYNKYFIIYCIISNVLNIILIFIIIKYLSIKKQKNNMFIYLINTVYFIQIIMISLLLYYNIWTNIKSFIESIGGYIVCNIILNAGLFFSMHKLNKANKIYLKLGIGLIIIFNLFIIIINNYESIYQNNIVVRTLISSTIIPIAVNIVTNIINKNIYIKKYKENNIA